MTHKSRFTNLTHLSELPSDILCEILKYAEKSKFPHVAKSCKRFNHILQNDLLWQEECLKYSLLTDKGYQRMKKEFSSWRWNIPTEAIDKDQIVRIGKRFEAETTQTINDFQRSLKIKVINVGHSLAVSFYASKYGNGFISYGDCGIDEFYDKWYTYYGRYSIKDQDVIELKVDRSDDRIYFFRNDQLLYTATNHFDWLYPRITFASDTVIQLL